MTSIAVLKARIRRAFRKKASVQREVGRGEGDRVTGLILQMHVGQSTHAFFFFPLLVK